MKKIFVLAALIVAILSSAAAQWRYLDDVDEMTDASSYYAYVQSTDGKRSFVMRATNGLFEAYVVWHEYMIVEEFHEVLVRFDSQPAVAIWASRATDRKASFLDADVISDYLVKNPKRMVVRLTETTGEVYTSTFDIAGVVDAAVLILSK